MSHRSWITAAVFLFAAPSAIASCGFAFCPINTQWEVQGPWQRSGLRIDLHSEYIEQDELWQGSERIAFGSVHAHHDEVRTVNRNTVLNLDYRFDQRWGVSLALPYVDREHQHIHNHHGHALPERWNIGGLGDARLRVRYHPAGRSLSFVAGLKLPTGDTSRINADGDAAERSLQPGTGTTDAILGATWYHADPASKLSAFVAMEASQPFGEHDGYARGHALNLDSGLRYALSPRVGLLLQTNARWVGRDQGAEAEPDDTGNRTVSVVPGISVAISPRLQAFAYWQKPVYQHVNGVQLSANHGLLTGVATVF